MNTIMTFAVIPYFLALFCIGVKPNATTNPHVTESVEARVIARRLDEAGNLCAKVIVENATLSAIYVHKDLLPVSAHYASIALTEDAPLSMIGSLRPLGPHVVASDLVCVPGRERIALTIKIGHRDGYMLYRAKAKVLYGNNPTEFQLEKRSRLSSAGEIDLWKPDE